MLKKKNIPNSLEKILKVSLKLFIKQGFDGTSMSDVAQKAGLSKPLLYHYFSSKQELWKEAKRYAISKIASDIDVDGHLKQQLVDPDNLTEFVKAIIATRFKIYSLSPDLVKIMARQHLEDQRLKIAGGTEYVPDIWEQGIVKLKKLGEIDASLDTKIIITYIASAITGFFHFDYYKISHDSVCQKAYSNLLLKSIVLGLRSKD